MIAPPVLLVKRAQVVVGDFEAVAAKVASGLTAMVLPREMRIDIGFAPRAPEGTCFPEVHDWHWLLARGELGEGLAHDRYGHVCSVGGGRIGWNLVYAGPHELARARALVHYGADSGSRRRDMIFVCLIDLPALFLHSLGLTHRPRNLFRVDA
jgi:hypothetical protein